MNWKTWVPLTLAIVLGLLAMKIARDVLGRNNAPTAKDESTQIVVLNKDLPAGSQIALADLGSRKMSGDINIQGVFTKPTDLEGRVLTSAGIKDTPIMQTMLAPKGALSGLQAIIPEGMRAITIEINEFTGIAGYLQPGCRVDLVSTFTADGEMLTRTVVQNLKVQAVGVRRAPEGDQPAPASLRSVTLLATPKEAEAIDLAVSAGRTRLVLRSNGDNNKPDSDGITVAELRGKAREAVGTDPFEPIQPAVTPMRPSNNSDSPSTQPASVATARHPATPRQRIVQFIRGTKEETTSVDEVIQTVVQPSSPTPEPANKPATPQEPTVSQVSSAADNDADDFASVEDPGAENAVQATTVDTDELTSVQDQQLEDGGSLTVADTSDVIADEPSEAEDDGGVTQADLGEVPAVAGDLNK